MTIYAAMPPRHEERLFIFDDESYIDFRGRHHEVSYDADKDFGVRHDDYNYIAFQYTTRDAVSYIFTIVPFSSR